VTKLDAKMNFDEFDIFGRYLIQLQEFTRIFEIPYHDTEKSIDQCQRFCHFVAKTPKSLEMEVTKNFFIPKVDEIERKPQLGYDKKDYV
jgi:hypothetical protein